MKKSVKLSAAIFAAFLFVSCGSITDATTPAENAKQVESASVEQADASVNWPQHGTVKPK